MRLISETDSALFFENCFDGDRFRFFVSFSLSLTRKLITSLSEQTLLIAKVEKKSSKLFKKSPKRERGMKEFQSK